MEPWEAAWALSNENRFRILVEYARATEPLPPSLVGERLGMSAGGTAYHVRALAKIGALRLVGTRPVRGALAHDYVIVQDATLSAILDALAPS